MTSLRFVKAAADDMAILLTINVSLRKITNSF
jgi:hypothetical protein